MASYTLKTWYLIVTILNSSYFVGMVWYIICELTENILKAYRADNGDPPDLNQGFFINEYNLVHPSEAGELIIEMYSHLEITLILTYFSFTSLSTVGFGDFNPKSDLERLLCAFILVFGVSLFSIIMGQFTEILDNFKNLNADLDHGEELACFLSMIQKFNGGKPIDHDFKVRIEDFFHYKWKYDRNQCLNSDDTGIDGTEKYL